MKHDFKVVELISFHNSVAFKIRGIGVQIPALPLTVGVLNLGKPVYTSINED